MGHAIPTIVLLMLSVLFKRLVGDIQNTTYFFLFMAIRADLENSAVLAEFSRSTTCQEQKCQNKICQLGHTFALKLLHKITIIYII